MRYLLLFLLLTACAQLPSVGESVEALKAACNAACAEDTSVAVVLPPDARLYTTAEAICVKGGNRLSCGTCGCATYGLEPQELAVGGNVTCAFSSVGERLAVVCE